jgi:hypothetical protein
VVAAVVRRSSSQQQEGRSSASSVGSCFFTLALPQAPSESPHKKLVKYFVFLEKKKKKKKILRLLCVCVFVSSVFLGFGLRSFLFDHDSSSSFRHHV